MACLFVFPVLSKRRPATRSLGRGELPDAIETAEAALATVEIRDRRGQIGGVEIGPQRVDEAELSVGGLPQQEIRQPLFSARADEEIDVGAGVATAAGEQAAEGEAGWRAVSEPVCRRVGDGVARRVVDRDPQM